MAQIIELRSIESPKRAARAVRPGESARILFFTGVRYERAPDTTPQKDPDGHAAAGTRRGRKRRA